MGATAFDLRDQKLKSFLTLRELERRKLEENFGLFLREAWKVLHPFEKLVDGWYLDCIAEYLMAVKKGQIRRLIVNQPPRTLKSTNTTICFPVWVWCTEPWWRFVFYSYSFDKLAIPHSLHRRRLILSDWYQARWKQTYTLSTDENRTDLFSNTASGRMEVVSQATGAGGKCLIIDDPHSAMQALSDAERTSGVNMVRQGLLTRLDTPETDPVILVMQRLHEKDATGSLLEDKGWTHLRLPAEAEERTRIFLPISGLDMVREKGDLLDPVRFPIHVLAEKKRDLGSIGYAGQYQQNPAPAGGVIFRSGWWRWWDPQKTDWRTLVDEVVISVDTSMKETTSGSDAAIQAWGLGGIRSYFLKRKTEQMDYPALKANIRAMMKEFSADLLLVENKSNGPAVMSDLKGEFHISSYNPDWGDKTVRAIATSPMVEAGDVYLPQNEDGVYIQGVATLFPNVAKKDDIDAMSQFLNWRRNRSGSLTWLKGMAEKVEKEQQENKAVTATPATASELHQAANEAAGLRQKDPDRKLTGPTRVIPSECKFCHSPRIFVASQGVWCRECNKRYPLEEVQP